MSDDLREACAKRANEERRRLIDRTEAKEGRPGVSTLRARLFLATHEALRAEIEAGR